MSDTESDSPVEPPKQEKKEKKKKRPPKPCDWCGKTDHTEKTCPAKRKQTVIWVYILMGIVVAVVYLVVVVAMLGKEFKWAKAIFTIIAGVFLFGIGMHLRLLVRF
jgi:uncharacterized membrane protein YagU involved in acid resistance